MKVIADLLERNACLHGDRAAFVFEGRTLTHRRFAERCFGLGNALHGLGLARQARVAVLSRNRTEYFEVFGGCGSAGLIAVNLNWRLAVPELAGIVADCEPDVLMFDAASAEQAEALRSDESTIRHWVAFDGAPEWARGYEALLAEGSATRPRAEVRPDDIESLNYTSGSTGRPKGVMLSHRAMLSAARAVAWDGDARATDRMLIVMPLFHVGGKLEQLAFFVAGATTILRSAFDPGGALRDLGIERITAAHLAPTMIAMLLDHPEVGTSDHSSLRLVHYASAPMPVSLLRRAIDTFGPVFLQIYGTTECATATMLKPFQHVLAGEPTSVDRLRSAGQPCVGVDIRIVDESGAPCPTGVPGEILIRADAAMTGYWNRSAETLAALQDGWFRTGDVGHLDAEGYLFIADRIKDMIISGGENIYSREVENALLAHPAVREAAVVGLPDPVWGESVKAYVVSSDGHGEDSAALIEHCRGLIASYKKPRFIEFVPALPRLSNGKLDKPALRAMAGQAGAGCG